MIHYTLNTAHSVDSQRSGVGTAAMELLSPLVQRGGILPGDFSAFSVEIARGEGGAVFTVWRAGAPIVTSGVAWTEAGAGEVWPGIEKLYLDQSDRYPDFYQPLKEPVQPAVLPWLSVVLLPGMLLQAKNDIGWLGDFERCMAWTIIDNAG